VHADYVVSTGLTSVGTVHDLLEAKGKSAALDAGMAPVVVNAAMNYMSNEDTGLGFAYAGWAQCALPHRKLAPEAHWGIGTENMRLLVEPGKRLRGTAGDAEFVGVPFGSHARLILLYLQTEALRTSSREVELGGSLRNWLSRIGVPYGGVTAKSVRDQAERLSMCKLSFHFQFSSGRKTGLVNQMIVDRAIFLEAEDLAERPRQGRLFLEAAKLSEGFFEQLQRHPLPVEEAAIKSLNNQSAALDCYLWLSYRLHVLNKDLTISWPAMRDQFGTAFKKLGGFKSWFLAPAGPLALALAVYPAAKVEVSNSGLILKPSKPPVTPRLLSSGG
jgi:Plasmid encoded RepA protein